MRKGCLGRGQRLSFSPLQRGTTWESARLSLLAARCDSMGTKYVYVGAERMF